MTLEEKVNLHLDMKEVNLKENSFKTFKAVVTNAFNLDSELLKKEVKEISEKNIISFSNKLKEKYGLSVRYRILCFFKNIILSSFEAKEIEKNIFQNIKMPNIYRYNPNKEILTLGEFNNLIEKISVVKSKDDFYKRQNIMFLILLFRTGLRHSEARALKWKNIDFENKTLAVLNSIYCTNNNVYEIVPTKTKSSARTIRIDDILLEMLKEYKKDSKFNNLGDFIFTTREGGPYGANLGKYFLMKARKLGIKTTSTHGLRHSHATYLMRNKINPLLVQKRMGHSNVIITLNTYTHFCKEDEKEIINLLNKKE